MTQERDLAVNKCLVLHLHPTFDRYYRFALKIKSYFITIQILYDLFELVFILYAQCAAVTCAQMMMDLRNF